MIRPTSASDAFEPALWETFVSTTQVHSSLRCIQGARLVRLCGRPSLPHAGHTVRTQHGITASSSAGQRRGDVEIRNYLRDQADSQSLVFDLSVTRDRFGSSGHLLQNGLLTRSAGPRCALRLAAKRKINNYRQQYDDNPNISLLPAIVSTSTRMHGEFWRLLFLQAHRETEAHFNAITTQQLGHVPFSPRDLLSEFEEQSRTRGGQSGGVQDRPQY